MADGVMDQGLNQSARNDAGIGTVNPIDAMGWSDLGALSASTTSIAGATNSQVNALDSTPSINTSTKTTTFTATLTSSQLNGVTITTITLHMDGAGADTGVFVGVDGLSFGKDSRIELQSVLTIQYADAT